jgi:hypothetical protein
MMTRPNQPGHLTFGSRISREFYKQASRFSVLQCSGPYNLTISSEKKFVWFKVAKVGTRTIINHFRDNQVRLDVDDGDKLYYCPAFYKDYLKFAFVRNPWDRLVSCWVNRVLDQNYFNFSEAEYEKMKKFENFVEYVRGFDIEDCNRHFRLQRTLMDTPNLDYVGRLETFADDFREICRRLNIKSDSVKPQNVSANRKKYQDYYTPELREKVYRIYQKDVQTFGYQF